MKLLDIAEDYVGLRVFNRYTQDKFLYVARLFDQRSDITHVKKINKTHLANFKSRSLTKCRPVTFNGYISYLRQLGNYLVEQGYTKDNPFKPLAMATNTGRPAYKILDDNVLAKVVEHIQHESHRYDPAWFWLKVIRFLALTGVRRRQLVHIRIGDVCLERMELTLKVEGSKTTREWIIPIDKRLVADIQDLKEKACHVLKRPLTDRDPLFNICWFNPRYKPYQYDEQLMSPMSITGFFKRLSRNSGHRLGAHRFRHTVATKLSNPVDGEPDLFSVKSILGHTMLSTTSSYVQPQMHRLSATLKKLDLPI